VLVIISRNEKLLAFAFARERPPAFRDEIKRDKLMKKMQMERKRGRRPGEVLQPMGRGIFVDQKATTRLKTIKISEMTKSVPALPSAVDSCGL
jgi:hypothetical protein